MSAYLRAGSRVCIVGGGPAGSFAALHLLRLMRQHGLDLEILIFEPRDFNRPGPGGCNRCAGILSSGLLRSLQELAIDLPEEVIQARVVAYAVNLDGETLRIEGPESNRPLVSIYRGGGPRLVRGEPLASFDGFLLSQACLRGARHVPERVRKVTWEQRPVVHTARERFDSDMVVLATGSNSRAPLSRAFGYRQPKTAIMAQDEILIPQGWPADEVAAFFQTPPGLIFGALTPKGAYLNVSLLGRGLATDAVADFLEAHKLAGDSAIQPASLCGCMPKIPIRGAKRYYGERWVAVGDAAVARLYKDGIGSAYQTAKSAMESALKDGISSRAFRKSYAPTYRRIASDNAYGRLLYRQWALTLRIPALLQGWKNAMTMERHLAPRQRIHMQVLWGMLSGDESYRKLFWRLLSPKAMGTLWQGMRGSKYHGG